MEHIEIKSELAGSVWKILANKGQEVSEGDELVVLESMKMEIPVVASEDGTIEEIKVSEGDNVSEGNVIIILNV